MAATPEQKHAAEALIRIRRVGNMYAGALDPVGRLLADGALVGPAGDRLSDALIDRYRTMRSALSTAFEQARHLAGPEGLGAAEPYLGTAPRQAPRQGAEIRSGDPGLIDNLISELTDAGSAWENAGRELAAILDGLGLSAAPGDSLRRAGTWIASASDDLRQRRLLLRASVPNPGVHNTSTVTRAGWGPGS